MALPKKLQTFIGKQFNDAAWDDIREQAAWSKIRLCKAFSTSLQPDKNGNIAVKKRNLHCYYTAFSRYNATARKWYLRQLLKNDSADLVDAIEQAQRRLQIRFSEEELENGTVTPEDLIHELSTVTGQTATELKVLMERMQGVLQQCAEDMQDKLETGKLYPWHRFIYKVTKINLPELPEERYAGKILEVEVTNNIISKMKLTS